MKKGFIIAIIILLIYLVLMIFLFSDSNNPNRQTKQEKQTIKNYFETENDEKIIRQVEVNNTGINKVKEQLQIIGVTGYDYFEPASYSIKNLNDNNLEYFKKYVRTTNDLSNLSVNQRIEFDFDNDGDLEQLLLISNVNDINAKKWFSAVYYIDKKINKVKLIEYSEYNQDNIKFELSNIVDMNNDDSYEILLKMSPDVGECYDLYTLEESIYKPVVLCDRPTV